MKFYTYTQNNSGGKYDATMPQYLIVQAESAEDANRRAEDAGVYFDGVDAGADCDCCGDRWSRADEQDATDQPCLYGEPVMDALLGDYWVERSIRILYAGKGRIDITATRIAVPL